MERGSVIDAQIEGEEQVRLELERCRDFTYWFYTYYIPHRIRIDTNDLKYPIPEWYKNPRRFYTLKEYAKELWKKNYVFQ